MLLRLILFLNVNVVLLYFQSFQLLQLYLLMIFFDQLWHTTYYNVHTMFLHHFHDQFLQDFHKIHYIVQKQLYHLQQLNGSVVFAQYNGSYGNLELTYPLTGSEANNTPFIDGNFVFSSSSINISTFCSTSCLATSTDCIPISLIFSV